jgi:hypothetical protein
MKTKLIIPVCLGILLLAGCTPEPVAPPADGDTAVAGFWLGLWHGFTILFTFVISLFNDSVGIYATPNSGNLYNLGYLFGVMMFFGSSCGGACKRK